MRCARLYLGILILTLTLQACAQVHELTLSVAKLQEDFHVFRSALEEGDSGLYRYVSKQEMDRVFDQTASGLNRPMSSLEFYRAIAPAMAAVECGHSRINLSKELQEQVSTRIPLLPVEIRVLNNNLYVFRDYSHSGLAGAQILKINGVPTEQILATMYGSMSGDGRIPTSKPWILRNGRTFSKLLYVLLGLQTTFHLEYIDQNQQQKESDLNGIELPKTAVNPTDRETELSWKRKDKFDFASLSLLDGHKIGILDIYSFDGAYADAKNTVRFTEFIDNAFEQLHDKKAESLVIDLRDNGGGEDEYGERLFSYLATEPYNYYDDLVINARKFSLDKYVPVESERREVATDKLRKRPDGKFSMIDHANLGLHQPRQPHFAGSVFILMNGGSFSTTAEFLSVATYHKAAIFIGEEEGGAYFGNTSGWIVHVVLPNSGLVLNLRPLTYYLSVKGDHPPDRGVMPDYHVSYSIHDWLAGKDKEMELALKLARSGLGSVPNAGR